MGLYAIQQFTIWSITVLLFGLLLWLRGFVYSYFEVTSFILRIILIIFAVIALVMIVFSPPQILWKGFEYPVVVLAISLFFSSIFVLIGSFLLIEKGLNWYKSSSFGLSSDISTDKHRRNVIISTAVAMATISNGFVFGKQQLVKTEIAVTRYKFNYNELQLSANKNIRIAFFSDLHAGMGLSPQMLDDLKKLIVESHPDVVLFGGDAVNLNANSIIELESFFLSLIKIAPILTVLGNHDYYDDADKIHSKFVGWGVDILRDDLYVLSNGITLAGIGDFEQEPVAITCLNKVEKTCILLAHNPSSIESLGQNSNKVALMLSGHTHGGQIVLPDVGPLVYMADPELTYGFVKKSGLPPLVVTRGVGCTSLPLRINCSPELVILDIKNV